MKFRIFGDMSEIGRVSKQFARDAVMSPLRKYIVYAVIFHAALIAVLSINMMIPEKPKEAAKVEGGKSAPGAEPSAPAAKDGGKNAARTGDGKSAAERAGAEKKPAKAGETPKSTAATAKPTGQKDDYYKRQGIDNAPAKQEEIPKNPFDAKDEMKKTLDDLK